MRSVIATLGFALVLAGCNAKSQKEDVAAAAQPARPVREDVGTETTPTGPLRLLEWLDPDAVAVLFVRLPPEVDPDTLSMVFAVPPKLEKMVRDATGVRDALEAVLDPDSPQPDEWLGPEVLATASLVGTGTYVIAPLIKPAAEVQAVLTKAGMDETTSEGFKILLPKRAFPYKVAFLTDDVVAFIPVKEIGTGLGPLTAGRDLPASEAEQQLTSVLKEQPRTFMELYAVGPLLHLDMEQDVLQFMMQVHPLDKRGMDVRLRMLTSRDPGSAADALSKRTADFENDQIQALIKRVAYEVEGGAVAGRLQLFPKDVALLGGAG